MLFGSDPKEIGKDALGLSIYRPDIAAVRQSGNLYAYCGNNPVMFVDPSGEFWNIVLGGVIGAVVFGAAKVVKNVVNGNDWHQGVGGAMAVGALVGAGGAAVAVKIGAAAAPTVIAAKVGASTVTTITAGGGAGFNTFNQLKSYLGSAGTGKVWHHIV